MKRWHVVVVVLAVVAIGAYLAMIVGPHRIFGNVTDPVSDTKRAVHLHQSKTFS